jgi:hypothetical protein
MTTATAQSAHDKNGSELFIGDEGVLRFRITDVRGGSILTTSFEPPHREYWFAGPLIERVAQGNASFEADRREALAPAAPAAVAPVGTVTQEVTADPASLREQAIAFVMSKGRDRAIAEKIVEEYGTRLLLEDRDEESRQANAAASGGTAAADTADNSQAGSNAEKPAEGTGGA